MATTSRVVNVKTLPDGKTATMAINYDPLLLTVLSITVINNSSTYSVTPRVVNTLTAPLTNLLSTVLPGTTQVFTGISMTLDSDLSTPAGWEVGMGYYPS